MIYVKFFSLFSKVIGYSIISISGLIYVQKIIFKPADKITAMALTAIAIIAALSALCFSYVSSLNDKVDKNTTLYAGEKFLHSTLLIIQTLFLKYIADQALTLELVNSIDWLKMTIQLIASILLFGIGGFAVTMAALGFHYLNNTLWNNYENRAKQNLTQNKNVT